MYIKMKREFSTKWKASNQPRNESKYLAYAPLHLRKKFFSVNLLKELRKKYGKRNIPARKGDIVKIMRGKFKKKQGKILKINSKTSRITVEGIQIKKKDGSKVNVKMQPSNLQIIELIMEDKKRIKKFGVEEKTNPKKIKTQLEKNKGEIK